MRDALQVMRPRLAFVAAAIAVAFEAPARLAAQVRVIDMIPHHMSDETFQNAEPSLAVNPRNMARMAASALTPGGDLCSRGTEAPIFVSSDTGRHWSIACKIHVDTSSSLPPGDITLRWSSDGDALFAAMLWPLNPLTLQVFSTPDPLSADDFSSLRRFAPVDQPDIEITTIGGTPRVFVAADFFYADTGAHPMSNGTAVIWITQPHPVGVDPPLVPVEQRNPSGPNYAIRVAAHPSGKVYALFYSPRPSKAKDPFVIEDLVLVRDDNGGLGNTPFTALKDSSVRHSSNPCDSRDGKAGFRVARCSIVPYNDETDTLFGNQRRVSANLSVAIDPSAPSTVWVAWADSVRASHYTLHVRRSADGGQTWTPDVLTIPNATNPALAVAADGTAGFLFQQLQGIGQSQRWVTRLFTSNDVFKTKRTYTLATSSSNAPTPFLQPYIGDYIELRAVGRSFFGVFSAANAPDSANFPNGVTFQRNVDWKKKLLLNAHGGKTIGVSIDPFFFAVGPAENALCPSLRRARNPKADDVGCK